MSKKANIASSAPLGVLALEAVAGAFERQQFGLDVGSLQPIDEPYGLLVGDVRVLRAVDRQAWAPRWA